MREEVIERKIEKSEKEGNFLKTVLLIRPELRGRGGDGVKGEERSPP